MCIHLQQTALMFDPYTNNLKNKIPFTFGRRDMYYFEYSYVPQGSSIWLQSTVLSEVVSG